MGTKTTGIILIIIGILMIVYTGFNYVTTKKVVDIGPVKIYREKSNYVLWLPIVGAALLVGGIGIYAVSKKSRT